MDLGTGRPVLRWGAGGPIGLWPGTGRFVGCRVSSERCKPVCFVEETMGLGHITLRAADVFLWSGVFPCRVFVCLTGDRGVPPGYNSLIRVLITVLMMS